MIRLILKVQTVLINTYKLFNYFRGKTVLNDIDLADEEVNDFLLGQTKSKSEDFTTKLKKIV